MLLHTKGESRQKMLDALEKNEKPKEKVKKLRKKVKNQSENRQNQCKIV